MVEKVKVSHDKRSLILALDYREPRFREKKSAVGSIAGRTYCGKTKCWSVPLALGPLTQFLSLAAKHKIEYAPGTFELIKSRIEQAGTNIEKSGAATADFEVKGLGGVLMPFQRAGVEYAARVRRTFIADQPGLGKTVQALATLQALGSFPALVVCPATIKKNWLRHALEWLPTRSAVMLSGTGAATVQEIAETQADIVIINYDIMADFERDDQEKMVPSGVLEALIAKQFSALIFDESHALKNGKAQRTRAAELLAAKSEVVLMLTGTPVVNRPAELVSQLKILGRLGELGGWYKFVTRYCDAYRDRFGWRVAGATNLEELNVELRAACYIRRLKSEVLKELPEKRRSTIQVEIDNRSEYDRAEDDLISWLVDQVDRDEEFMQGLAALADDERREAISKRKQSTEASAIRAEQLVRIGVLKSLSARGKLKQSVDWINDFLESGEKLIVFAEHVEIQKELLAKFPDAAYIVPSLDQGDVDRRQAQVDRFQTDESCRLIVCSLGGGGLGWTGTAASNVLFVEMAWAPATMEQAEDRAHRIGQHGNVTAWYLLGENTIDQSIWELIEQKRLVVDAATDGEQAGGGSVLKGLIGKLVGSRR